MKRYTIKFESSHKQWMVIDTQDPEGFSTELGYYYEKTDAQGVADMLNQRIELLAALEDMAGEVKAMLQDAGSWGEKSYYAGVQKRLNTALKAIANTKGGE